MKKLLFIALVLGFVSTAAVYATTSSDNTRTKIENKEGKKCEKCGKENCDGSCQKAAHKCSGEHKAEGHKCAGTQAEGHKCKGACTHGTKTSEAKKCCSETKATEKKCCSHKAAEKK